MISERKLKKYRKKNKYHLKPNDITMAIVINEARLHDPPFWRNTVINAWVLSNSFGDEADLLYGTDSYYCIIFYDKDAKHYGGKITLDLGTLGGMCRYNISGFFIKGEVETELEFDLQVRLLDVMNWLIDENIIKIPAKK